MKILLTIDEAAEALACSRRSMYRLLAAGGITPIKIGSLTRIPVDAIHSYVQDQIRAANFERRIDPWAGPPRRRSSSRRGHSG
jgi:excisionase family DNA binding protein